jgi:predicted PurR-regulated permease PerM
MSSAKKKNNMTMEKGILKYLLIILIFFFGLMLGENFNGQNQGDLLDQEKEQFENEITKPNNDYTGKYPQVQNGPDPNISTSIAQTIDKGITGIVDKFFSTIAKLISSDDGAA